MGVLNVTPDSFTDGGKYLNPDQAYARALELEEQGADILDLGAESTRPESRRVSAEEEWQRLAPVLKRLRGKLGIPLSLDTYKAETARRALDYGIEIINDPSGLTFDAELAKVAVEGDTGLILNHMRGTPESWGGLPPIADIAGAVVKDLDATASRARRAGVDKSRIVLDPGLGFGKRKEQNSDILAQLGRLAELDYPILVGPSRKSFLAHLAPEDALFATAAAVTAAILNGADLVRVHDVKAMKAVAAVADEISRMAAVVADRIAEEEDAERQAKKARGFGAKPLPPFLTEERVPAMRPPLMKVVKPPVPVVAEAATPEAAVPAEGAQATAAQTAESRPEAEIPVEKAVEAAVSGEAAVLDTPSAGETVRSPEADEDIAEDGAEEDDDIEQDEDIEEDDDVEEDEEDEAEEVKPAPPSDKPAKAWGNKPAFDTPRKARPAGEGFEPPRRSSGPAKSFDDRGPRRDFRPPQGDRPRFDGPRFSGPPRDGGDRPPRRDFDGPPPRRNFDGPPPRRDFDGPPRREGGGYGPPRADGPPRRSFDGPPPRRDFSGPPPRRNFDGPPPRREGGYGPPRGGAGGYGPPRDGGDRPPRRDFGDRPPNRGGDGPPRGDSGGRPPYKPFGGPPRRDDGGRPPFRGGPNDRPFRPSGPRPDDRGGDRPSGPRNDGPPGGDRPYGSPGGKKLFRKRP